VPPRPAATTFSGCATAAANSLRGGR
jgi:hypothetical protein